jgi:hypothetical protein
MANNTNPASPGSATPVTAESPVRRPLDSFTPWTTPGAPAVGGIPIGFDQQVQTVPNAVVDFLGQPMNRR